VKDVTVADRFGRVFIQAVDADSKYSVRGLKARYERADQAGHSAHARLPTVPIQPHDKRL
jgi:hypothetical protein